MQNKCVQLELSCEDVMSAMEENDYKLITLLEKYLDFDALIPVSFHCAYYLHKGRKRINALTSFVKALLLKQILGMKEDTQLLILSIILDNFSSKTSKRLSGDFEILIIPSALHSRRHTSY